MISTVKMERLFDNPVSDWQKLLGLTDVGAIE
jgi:hypothetical protein